VGQKVQATVVEVDLERNRIALSMKTRPEIGPRQPGQPRKEARPAQPASFNRSPFNDAFGKLGQPR
jgi:uncharacterized protein